MTQRGPFKETSTRWNLPFSVSRHLFWRAQKVAFCHWPGSKWEAKVPVGLATAVNWNAALTAFCDAGLDVDHVWFSVQPHYCPGKGGENREELVKRWEKNGEKNAKWGRREFYSCRRTWLLWETHSEVFLDQCVANPFQRRRLILIRERINGGGMTKHQLLPLPQSK